MECISLSPDNLALECSLRPVECSLSPDSLALHGVFIDSLVLHNGYWGLDALALEYSLKPGWFGTGMFTEAWMVCHRNVHGGVDALVLECSRRPGWFGTGMFSEALTVWHWNVHGGLDGLAQSRAQIPPRKAERGSGVLNDFSCHMGRGRTA